MRTHMHSSRVYRLINSRVANAMACYSLPPLLPSLDVNFIREKKRRRGACVATAVRAR